MALFQLNESGSLVSAENLLEQLELVTSGSLMLEDATAEEEKYEDLHDKIIEKEQDLKKVIDNKSKSWLERKLTSFKTAIERFERKHKLTKDNKSKTIIKKILSVLTRIVKWINDKLIKATRFVDNKLFKGRREKNAAGKESALRGELKDLKERRNKAWGRERVYYDDEK